jgi:hypothetical protein
VERIRQKIGRIIEHLAIIRAIKNDCTTRFSADPVYRGALLHYLYLYRFTTLATITSLNELLNFIEAFE